MSDTEKPEHSSQYIPPENSLGERIRERRKELDLTVDQLAALAAYYDFGTEEEDEKGLSVSALYLYEKGERLPRAKEMRLLCEALNVSPNWLLLGEEWDSKQAADSELADAFRKLIKDASNPTQWLFDKGASRMQMHQIKIAEIKNRSK